MDRLLELHLPPGKWNINYSFYHFKLIYSKQDSVTKYNVNALTQLLMWWHKQMHLQHISTASDISGGSPKRTRAFNAVGLALNPQVFLSIPLRNAWQNSWDCHRWCQHNHPSSSGYEGANPKQTLLNKCSQLKDDFLYVLTASADFWAQVYCDRISVFAQLRSF